MSSVELTATLANWSANRGANRNKVSTSAATALEDRRRVGNVAAIKIFCKNATGIRKDITKCTLRNKDTIELRITDLFDSF